MNLQLRGHHALVPLAFLGLFALAQPTLARVGVGVGTGKIQVDEILRPGTIYTLPSFSVINTGDEPTAYTIGVAYHEGQSELRPAAEWFDFSPRDFDLGPENSQVISMKLDLPLKMEPGKYFAYVEAQPVPAAASGETVVGIAAATKVHFTVAPANPLQGIWYKIASAWKVYSPWSERVALFLGLIVAYVVVTRLFQVQVRRKR